MHFESPVNSSDVSGHNESSEENYYFFHDMDCVPKHVLKHSRVQNTFDVYDAYYYYSKQAKVRHKLHIVAELCSNYTVIMKLKYPCCCFAKAPALSPLKCSSNVEVEVELTHGTRLGMYEKTLGCNLDF